MTTPDPIDTEALADATEAKRQRDELKQRQEVEDWKWLMAHKQGRRLAHRCLDAAGVFRNPFNHSGSVTAFNCGQMNQGQWMLAQIMEHAPEAYMQMLKEHKLDDN